MKNGVAVWYYRYYDTFGQRTVGRSIGKTNKTLAERYCNELLRQGELVLVKEILFSNYAVDWWNWNHYAYMNTLKKLFGLKTRGNEV